MLRCVMRVLAIHGGKIVTERIGFGLEVIFPLQHVLESFCFVFFVRRLYLFVMILVFMLNVHMIMGRMNIVIRMRKMLMVMSVVFVLLVRVVQMLVAVLILLLTLPFRGLVPRLALLIVLHYGNHVLMRYVRYVREDLLMRSNRRRDALVEYIEDPDFPKRILHGRLLANTNRNFKALRARFPGS
jgi:hypothetical protein